MSTITLQPNGPFGVDAYTDQLIPNTNYGTTAATSAGTTNNARRFGLLKFDFRMIPAGSTINSATLYLYNTNTAVADRHFAIHAMLAANSAWTEAGATWNYAVNGVTRWAGDAAGDGGADAGCSVSGTDWNAVAMGTFTYTGGNPAGTEHACSLNTAQVATMLANNYGMVLRMTDANTAAMTFASSDYFGTNPALCPKLVIDFTPPDNGTIILQPDPLNAEDTYLESGANADKNYGITASFAVGLGGATDRALLRISWLSIIPAGSTITSAILSLYCSAETNATDRAVAIHRCLTQWYEGVKNSVTPDGGQNGSTWNHRNQNGDVHWGAAGGQSGTDYVALATATVTITGPGVTFTWDVTADVQLFVNGTNNYGWFLIGDELNANSLKTFVSSDSTAAGTPGICPSLTVTYTPSNIAPTAVISAPATGCDCVPVTLDGTGSSDPDGIIAAWDWDFGDGSPHGSGATVDHTYAAGTWTITLTVTDDDGATDDATQDITIYACPNAVISAPATGTDCEGVRLDGSGSNDPDGTIVTYAWDFGDGTGASGAAVSHDYGVGSYTITLTVTDDQGCSDSATASITITACTEVELYLVPDYYRSTELTVTARASILNVYGVGEAFDRQYRRELTGYQHELRADGGYYACEFSLAGTQQELEDWFENGLGRDVTVYNPALETIWEGFVNEVALELGPLSVSRGPLLEVANIISGAYTPLNTTVSPPVAGLRATYAAVTDLASRNTWGPFVRQLSIGQCSAAEAAQYVNSILAQDAWPKTTHRLSSSGGGQKVTLRCAGYVRLLEAEPYIATGVTGTINVSDKVADVLAGVAFNTLWTNTAISQNTRQVTADEPTNNGRPAWEIIKGCLSYGDINYNRYTFSVGANRRATYAVIPSTVAYYRRLSDPGGRILTAGGDTVDPWDVKAGLWLFYTDFLVGRPQITALRRDPRNMFIETCVWRAPDPAPTLTGAKYTTVPYQIARQGLSGR